MIWYLVMIFTTINGGIGMTTVPTPYPTEAACIIAGKKYSDGFGEHYRCVSVPKETK